MKLCEYLAYVGYQSGRHFYKQGVALTGRNTTGPQSAALGELRCAWSVTGADRRRRQTTDGDRRQRALLVWPLCGPVIIMQQFKR